MGKLFRRRKENRRRIVAVFRLPQEIGGADLTIHCVIGDDKRLSGTSNEVNTDTAEKLALGLGHKGIAGSYDN